MATNLLYAGETISTVQARLGHRKASTTLDIYAHALRARDEEAAAAISGSRHDTAVAFRARVHAAVTVSGAHGSRPSNDLVHTCDPDPIVPSTRNRSRCSANTAIVSAPSAMRRC